MKQHNLTIVLLFLVVFSWKSYGQEINYGSNHGKHITISNTNIYYEEYGSGMPLLLFHGGFGSIHDFQQVIPKLSKHYRVIAVDSPGHGRSEQADSLSFDLMADYYSIMIDQFKLDSVYIIGYSDGGITRPVAQGYAFSAPPGVKLGQRMAPSLINIYKEAKSGNPDGNLRLWDDQGVLLLNCA